jgi:hypothetical protein
MSELEIVNLTPQQRFRLNHPNYYQEYVKAHPQTKEYSAKTSRQWRKTHTEENRANQKIYRKEHPDVQKHLRENMKLKYPLKFQCRRKSQQYPLASSCAICKSESDLHRHHTDYSKPQIFTTLCRQCHQAIHLYLGVT